MLKSILGPVALCPLLTSSTLASPLHDPGTRCAIRAPVAQVTGTSFYTDPAGSELDQQKLKRHLERIAPVRAFAAGLVVDIDDGRLTCAESNLRTWAAASALLKRPESFSGIRERQRFTLAINLAVLKLVQKGRGVDSTIKPWLIALNREVMNDFRRRGVRDNLYVWSGAAAATGARATGNVELRDYAAEVWREATAAIGPQGRVPSELRRASRAVLYHAFYLAGLLVLESSLFGSTSGDPRLVRLFDAVRDGTCNPGAFAAVGGSLRQSPPNRDDLATITSLMTAKAHLCGADQARNFDPLRGGSSSELPDLLTRPGTVIDVPNKD